MDNKALNTLLWSQGLYHGPVDFQDKRHRGNCVKQRQLAIRQLVFDGDIERLRKFPEWSLSRAARKGLPCPPHGGEKVPRRIAHEYLVRITRLFASLDRATWAHIRPPKPKAILRPKRKKAIAQKPKPTQKKALHKKPSVRYAKPGHTLSVYGHTLTIGRERSIASVTIGTMVEIARISRATAKLLGLDASQRETANRNAVFHKTESGIPGFVLCGAFVPLSRFPLFTKFVVVETPPTAIPFRSAARKRLRA